MFELVTINPIFSQCSANKFNQIYLLIRFFHEIGVMVAFKNIGGTPLIVFLLISPHYQPLQYNILKSQVIYAQQQLNSHALVNITMTSKVLVYALACDV